jgi:hypothetical protein
MRQQVTASLGRYDELRDRGQLDRLLRSGTRFASQGIVPNAARGGTANDCCPFKQQSPHARRFN